MRVGPVRRLKGNGGVSVAFIRRLNGIGGMRVG